MTREIYAVCVLRWPVWIDVAEFDGDDPAFVMADELRATELDTKVVRRWVEKGHINQQKNMNDTPEEPFFVTEEIEAEMKSSGYVFEPPDHVSTVRLTEILAAQSDVEVAALLIRLP